MKIIYTRKAKGSKLPTRYIVTYLYKTYCLFANPGYTKFVSYDISTLNQSPDPHSTCFPDFKKVLKRFPVNEGEEFAAGALIFPEAAG